MSLRSHPAPVHFQTHHQLTSLMVAIILSLFLLLNFVILSLHKLPCSATLEELKDLGHQPCILERRSSGLTALKRFIDYALTPELSVHLGPVSDLLELFGRFDYLPRSFPD